MTKEHILNKYLNKKFNMTLPINVMDDYESWTLSTAIYPEAGSGSLNELLYLGLGLAGEAGEVANKVKKLYRDGDSLESREKIKGEIRGVLWYLARLTRTLHSSLNFEALENMDELESRKLRGVIGGSGDNR